jgi:eukaryotic-like serine/threonine-protein kinase
VAFEIPGYTVVGHLGHGARTTILQVADLRTGQVYALKRVVKRSSEDNRYLEQVENEYQIASQVDHPAMRKCPEIRRIRKWMQVRELWLFMEYIDGSTLEEERPGTVLETLDYLTQIAECLDVMHNAGYVHADVKPNNIMRHNRTQVKIIDFGQSCRIGHVKSRIQGTPDYIAPEQVRRAPIDRRTDVFNLGATLYWLVTGRPFPTLIHSTKRIGSIDLAGSKEAIPPHEVNSEVPPALSKLILECCEERPQDRPSTMKQVLTRFNVVRLILEKQQSSNNHRLGGIIKPAQLSASTSLPADSNHD